MTNTETLSSKIKPGGEVDSWCGKCKMVLAHTIEAMVGEKPARVHCNTCKSQHAYKAKAPGTSTKSAGGTRTPRTRASKYETLLKSKDAGKVRAYSISEKYAE